MWIFCKIKILDRIKLAAALVGLVSGFGLILLYLPLGGENDSGEKKITVGSDQRKQSGQQQPIITSLLTRRHLQACFRLWRRKIYVCASVRLDGGNV